MKRTASFAIVLLFAILTSCTKNEQTPANEIKNVVAIKQSVAKPSTANVTSFVYSGDSHIGVSYDPINNFITVSFYPPSGTNSEPFYVTIQDIPGNSYVISDVRNDMVNPVHYFMEQGSILLITIKSERNIKYQGAFYDVNSAGASYTSKSSPFPAGGFHWTVSAMDGDSLGVTHINWQIPNTQSFPIMPRSDDKYYFFYSMYDHTRNQSVQFIDSASIFDGQKTLGRPYAYYNYDYVNVKLYIKGLRMPDGQSYYLPGITNGEFVNSYNNISRNTIQQYGTQSPGAVITNGSYYYEPVSIDWQ